MGDRCYMIVACRKEDTYRFEDLGFIEDSASQFLPAGVVEMVDEEANYAHASDMPEDIVYFGHNSTGYDYGASSFACDGKELFEVGVTADGYYYARLDENGKVIKHDLKVFKNYRKALRKVCASLGMEPE